MIDYQEILDRIASLERTVRNIGIGQEFVLGNLHAIGKIVGIIENAAVVDTTAPTVAEGKLWYDTDATATPGGFYSDYIHIRDEKSDGTDGGTFTQDAWQTRVLTDELDDTGGDAALASNQITLEAGTYRCLVSCPAYRCDRHKARLQNISDVATELVGSSEFANDDDNVSNRSFIVGRFTLAAQKVLEVQHRCEVTQADTGFGIASNFGVVEVYTEVELWKEV